MAICSRNIKLKEISAISIISIISISISISIIIIVFFFISWSLFTINILCFSSSPAPKNLCNIKLFNYKPHRGLGISKGSLSLSSPSPYSIPQIFREILNCSIMKPVYLKRTPRRLCRINSIQTKEISASSSSYSSWQSSSTSSNHYPPHHHISACDSMSVCWINWRQTRQKPDQMRHTSVWCLLHTPPDMKQCLLQHPKGHHNSLFLDHHMMIRVLRGAL